MIIDNIIYIYDTYGRESMSSIRELQKEIIKIVGPKRVTTEYIDRVFYSRDLSVDPTELPSMVVLPKTTEEVSKIVKIANKYNAPIFTFGRGSTLLGLKVKENSIVISTSGMNKILDINTASLTVTTEAGAVWLAVNSTLWKQGYELSSQWHGGVISATLGGAVAANAIARTSEPGTQVGDTLVGLRVVLPNGEIITTGSAANPKSHPFERYTLGPDITGLFIGSSGTFGIITEVSFRIRRKRKKNVYLSYAFKDYRDAVAAVEDLQQNELIQFAILVQGDLPPEKQSLLHIIITGDETICNIKKEIADALCRSHSGTTDNSENARLFWETYYYSWLRGVPTQYYYVRKGVPYYCPEVNSYFSIRKLPLAYDAFWEYWNEVEKANIEKHRGILKGIDTFFTYNGGFIWLDPLFPVQDPEAVKYGFKVRKDMTEKFMELGGCPTAISSSTSQLVFSKLGTTYEFMKLLKKAIDPKNLLNPGVLFPEVLE